MRDLVMLLVLPFLIYAILKRPFIGVSLWLWTALFNPNGWVYGMAGSIRYNMLFAFLTFVSYLFYKNKVKFTWDNLTILVLIFTIISFISTVLTIGNTEVAWEYHIRFIKTVVLFYMMVIVFSKKIHIDTLIWVIALSTCFYGCVEALKFMASGGGHKIAGMPGHALADNNELALAFTMFIPFIVYLLREYGATSKLIKLVMLGVIAMLIISILGTYSRGGLIALMVLGGYFFLSISFKGKAFIVLILLVLIPVIFNMLPDAWFERMNTIENASEDSSFMGRVVAWKVAFMLAVDSPFFGAGIKAIENHSVWLYQATNLGSLDFISTPEPDLNRGYAAHSIYFQVLSETGFFGLFIFLSIILVVFKKLKRVIKFVKESGDDNLDWALSLATMLRLSLVAYCVGGAALNFAYFEGVYALFAITYALDKRILPANNKTKAHTEQIKKREQYV